MKVCFHLDNLSLRGTTTAILDYAKYNESLLGNESIIAYNQNLLSDNRDQNFSKRYEITDKFKELYTVIEYSTKNVLKEKLDELDCDHIYFLKSGFMDDNYLEGKKNLIHCVFNFCEPHGHRYAYVSKWLANEASKGKCDFVPHIVNLPRTQTENIRKKLGISSDKIVVGRYGGFDQFDIDFVKSTVGFIAQNDPSFVFVFVNTRKFIEHPNVFFLDPILEPQDKTNFILSCDIMLHGRSDGESFGLSVCEFLFHDKPVFSCGLGRDKNNVELLEKHGLIYNNQYQLLELFFQYKLNPRGRPMSRIVDQFSPAHVMEKFKEVFLND